MPGFFLVFSSILSRLLSRCSELHALRYTTLPELRRNLLPKQAQRIEHALVR